MKMGTYFEGDIVIYGDESTNTRKLGIIERLDYKDMKIGIRSYYTEAGHVEYWVRAECIIKCLNKYHVGDRVYCTITHGVVEVIDIGRTYFSETCLYKVQSIHSKAIYSQVEEKDLNKYLVASYAIQGTDYTKYKVGDIVEFRNDDDALEYGLIKDIGEIYDPIRDNCKGHVFQVAHGPSEISYLSMDRISHRCNKYRVGQRVWRTDLALECVITRVLLINHSIRYYVRSIANNEEYFTFEYQLMIRPTNYGLARNDVDKVIFNDPATIIIWKDGTKTVVKTAPGETYSKWAGMALCISKKLYGDRFHRIFKEYCGEEEEKEDVSGWQEWHKALVDTCKNMRGKNDDKV